MTVKLSALSNLKTIIRTVDKIKTNSLRYSFLLAKSEICNSAQIAAKAAVILETNLSRPQADGERDAKLAAATYASVVGAHIALRTLRINIRALYSDVEKTGSILCEVRRNLALGSRETPGFAVKSLQSATSTETETCYLRKLSNILGDAYIENANLFKSIRALLGHITDLQSRTANRKLGRLVRLLKRNGVIIENI